MKKPKASWNRGSERWKTELEMDWLASVRDETNVGTQENG